MVHTSRINALRTRYGEPFFILCVCVVFTTAYALWVGQDASWDQKNYYFYSVYAWLKGRTFRNVAPGQITTWLNPLPYLLQYLLIQSAPPVVAGLLMGALAGLNGLMLWLLARRLQRGDPTWQGRVCAYVIILVGLTGSIFLSEVGTTFADYLSSVLVLGGLISITPPPS